MAMLANKAKNPTDCIFGISPDGKVVHMPLSVLPHLLVAGTTGSGKSVLLNQMAISMMQHSSPVELKFMIIDPKKVEFSKYRNSPYMMANPITDVADAYDAVVYLTIVMDERYDLFDKAGVKNLEDYNIWAEKNGTDKLPYIILLVDEFSDLIMQHREVEEPMIRIGQKARAAGIHGIIATQSPRATVITGLIKANYPSRLSLMVASSLESGIILDENGGEKLRPHGDMFIKANGGTPIRAQSSFISDPEIDSIFEYQRKNYPEPEFVDFKKIVADFNAKKESGVDTSSSTSMPSSLPTRPPQDNKSFEELSPLQRKRKAKEEMTGEKRPSLARMREEKLKKLAELMGEDPPSQNEPENQAGSEKVTTEDALLPEAIQLMEEQKEIGREVSIPMLQRRFRIGYNRAVTLKEQMDKRSVLNETKESQPTKKEPEISTVLIKKDIKKSTSPLMRKRK